MADEVDYKVEGEWPDLTRGGGSSMELAHPDADNDFGSAWRSSDESLSGGWGLYRHQGRYLESRRFGGVRDYKEIYFHLVGDGHLELRNIRLVRLRDGTDLIANGDVTSPQKAKHVLDATGAIPPGGFVPS